MCKTESLYLKVRKRLNVIETNIVLAVEQKSSQPPIETSRILRSFTDFHPVYIKLSENMLLSI